MNSDKSFSISYSGKQDDELNAIKAKYIKNDTALKMKELKRLDKSVDFIATMFSILFGMIGVLFITIGACVLIYSKIPFPSTQKIFAVISIIAGLAICSATPIVNYFISEKQKEKITPKILELIKEIEGE